MSKQNFCSLGRGLCSSKKEEDGDDEDKGESKLEVQFFSVTTLYYVVSTWARGVGKYQK